MQTKFKIIVAVVAVLAISSLIFYFIILPTTNDIKKISEDVYLERLDLEKKYLKGQLLKKTMADFEKIKPEQERLTEIFINEGEELKFITALEKLSSANSLQHSLKLGISQIAVPNDIYLTNSLDVIVKGQFNDLIKYLNGLEKLKYYYNINDITLSGNTGGLAGISAVIKGNIFILPKPTEENNI